MTFKEWWDDIGDNKWDDPHCTVKALAEKAFTDSLHYNLADAIRMFVKSALNFDYTPKNEAILEKYKEGAKIEKD